MILIPVKESQGLKQQDWSIAFTSLLASAINCNFYVGNVNVIV